MHNNVENDATELGLNAKLDKVITALQQLTDRIG